MSKRKTKQKDLENKELETPEVNEAINEVNYISLVYKTDKFVVSTRDQFIEGLDSKGLMDHIQKRIRPVKDAEIKNGDFDKACELIHKVLTGYPH